MAIKIDYSAFIQKNFRIIDQEKQIPVDFLFKPVQRKYMDILLAEYPNFDGIREILLKARQEGFSSLILAIFTVDFILRPYSVSICISHRKDSTELLFKKVLFYLESFCEKRGINLKDYLSTKNRGMIENRFNNAVFYIGTAGAKVGGRGGSARNIHFSESAFYADTELITAEEMVTATSQQVPQGHGMIFIESCVSGNTMIFTEDGLVPIKKYMFPKLGFTKAKKIQIHGRYGMKITDKFYNSGKRATKIVTSKWGYSLEGTYIHPIVILENGKLVKKKLQDIKINDLVCIQYGQQIWGDNDSLIFKDNPRGNPSGIGISLNSDVAYFLGLFLAEGYARKQILSGQIVISSGDEQIHQILPKIISTSSWRRYDKYHSRTSNTNLYNFIENFGFSIKETASKKIFPRRILEASKKNIAAFISGMFDGDGCSRRDTGDLSYVSTSLDIVKTLQIILLNFGILSKIYKHKPHLGGMIKGRQIQKGNMSYQLEINGQNARTFYKEIGFRLKRKQNNQKKQMGIKDAGITVYGIREEIRRLLKKENIPITSLSRKHGISNAGFYNKLGGFKQRTLKQILSIVSTPDLEELANNCYFIDKVNAIKDGKTITYDFHIPDGHSFISNGFLSFNTANGVDNYYQKEWERAQDGFSTYKPRFFGWKEYYSEAWVKEKRKDFSTDAKWKQEYPGDPDEAFISSGTPYFDNQILKVMLDRAQQKNPILQQGIILPDGNFN